MPVWADIEIEGCRFHLAQSRRWKIQEVELNNEYKDKLLK